MEPVAPVIMTSGLFKSTFLSANAMILFNLIFPPECNIDEGHAITPSYRSTSSLVIFLLANNSSARNLAATPIF